MGDEPNKKSLQSEQFTRPMFVFEVEQPSSRARETTSGASVPPQDSLQAGPRGSLVTTAHMFGALASPPRMVLDAERDVRGGYASSSQAGVRVAPTAFVGISSTRSSRRAEPARDEPAARLSPPLAATSLAACQIIQASHPRTPEPPPSASPQGRAELRGVPQPHLAFGPSDTSAQATLSDLSVTPLRPYPSELRVTPRRPYASDLSVTPARPQAPAQADTPTPPVAVQPASEPLVSPLKLSARSPLFRREALLAYRRGERAASVLQVTSVSRWTLLLALAAALALALAVVSFGQVEERSAARGVLRMPFGLQPVVPLIGGTVREVLVAPGALVQAGQLLVRLDATPLAAELGEAEQRLSALEAQWQRQSESLKSNFERGLALTNARIALLAQRRRNQARRIARRHSQAERMDAPELADVVERTVREQTADALDGAKDELLQLSDGLSELRLSQSASRSEYEQQLAAGEQRLRDARARRDAARVLLQQSELHAPIAGKVESLRVHAGQTVQPGEWVARVVRAEAPSAIVAFVPERDAAFLRKGAHANVEIDKLPVGEFGFAHAHVERVVGEIAEPSELTAALGEAAPQGPHVRVELALTQSPETTRVRPFLRAGTLVTARIALRDRRLLAIVFEPARRWLR